MHFYKKGGDLDYVEASIFEWKKEKKVWKIMDKGDISTYLDKIHGSKKEITQAFVDK